VLARVNELTGQSGGHWMLMIHHATLYVGQDDILTGRQSIAQVDQCLRVIDRTGDVFQWTGHVTEWAEECSHLGVGVRARERYSRGCS